MKERRKKRVARSNGNDFKKRDKVLKYHKSKNSKRIYAIKIKNAKFQRFQILINNFMRFFVCEEALLFLS